MGNAEQEQQQTIYNIKREPGGMFSLCGVMYYSLAGLLQSIENKPGEIKGTNLSCMDWYIIKKYIQVYWPISEMKKNKKA